MLSRRRSSFGWLALVVPSWVPHHPWAQRAYVAAARTVARLRPGSWRTAVLMPRRDGVSEAALRRALDELPHGERYMLAEGLVGHRKPYAPVEDPHLGGAPRRRGHDATDEPGELERAREIVAAWGVQIRPGYWRDEFTLAPCRFQPDGVPEFGEFGTVAGMVGRGHEAYVRILHPVSAAESRRRVAAAVGGPARCECGGRAGARMAA